MTQKDANLIYRNLSIVAIVLGLLLGGTGSIMGGFTSATWASLIGAGAALIGHGLLGVLLSYIYSTVRNTPVSE